MKNKLWRLYAKGEERFCEELDIVTILANLRNLTRFMNKQMKDKKYLAPLMN